MTPNPPSDPSEANIVSPDPDLQDALSKVIRTLEIVDDNLSLSSPATSDFARATIQGAIADLVEIARELTGPDQTTDKITQESLEPRDTPSKDLIPPLAAKASNVIAPRATSNLPSSRPPLGSTPLRPPLPPRER